MIKLMYSAFLGLILVTFIGVGVSLFYEAPTEPEYPVVLERIDFEQEETAEMKQAREEYDVSYDAFDKEMRTYSRNVAIITMVFAVTLLYVAIAQEKKLEGISEGVLLGGVLTLMYSLMRSLMAGDDMTSFLFLAAGLAVAIWVGKTKFTTK